MGGFETWHNADVSMKFLTSAFLAGSALLAQTAAPTPASMPSGAMFTATSSVGMVDGSLAGAVGQPFSAQQESTSVQVLADGTRITGGTQTVKMYRDSQGRVRTEHAPPTPQGFPAATAPPVFTEISDPVGGYIYTFDSMRKVVHRSAYRIRKGAIAGSGPVSIAVPAMGVATNGVWVSGNVSTQLVKPETSTASLGTQNVEGVLADGSRVTTVWPVGAFGNDRPVTTITETWTSRELGMTILSKSTDPRWGESTTKLTNISRVEPDASLFQTPSGFEIEDREVQIMPAVALQRTALP